MAEPHDSSDTSPERPPEAAGSAGRADRRRRSLTDQVIARLRAAIIDGELKLGENISEERLATAYGISRTPVRDALAALQFQGLVTVRPKRGSYVFSPTAKDVADLCDYRKMLEREALVLSMAHRPDDLLDRLERLVADMRSARAADDHAGYNRADTAFHRAFFATCDNGLVCQAYDLAEARIAAVRTSLISPYRDRIETSYTEHTMMLQSLRKGDVDAACEVLGEHIDRTRTLILLDLDRTRVLDPSG
ncbi:GntR family transcriptional regulator [Roseospira navarrensis]|uniref:FCD domain-containing protein n=1 Tax=Roseospira navarrensis TaxID=140058 RepID=A0A7X1ZEJ6_9PROT|nr:GntR family transcriptional regulator [Roseospira navarrensis]MQX37046.1 FCD domain-containing protein [Roseospira navarrensis]